MSDAFLDLHCQIIVVWVLGLCQSMMVGGTQSSYHLSAPHGNSINDCINPKDYTLSYCSVEGPSTNFTFLEIVIKTITMTVSISSEQKQELLSLQSMIEHHKCTKQ